MCAQNPSIVDIIKPTTQSKKSKKFAEMNKDSPTITWLVCVEDQHIHQPFLWKTIQQKEFGCTNQ